MTDSNLILDVSAERLQEVLQSAGYRVTVSEQNGMVQLLSASQGVGFAARMGNPALPEGQFLDYTLSCAARAGRAAGRPGRALERGKRFARLTVQGAFLVLELDVIVAGGVSENYLLATTELWDRLLQEFLLFLRANAAPGAGEEAGQSQESLSEAQAESAAEPTTHLRRAGAGVRDGGSGPCPPPAASACQLVRQTMNSILKQPTKVRIAAAVLLVAGAAGAVALMRGSPAQSSESKPAPQAAAAGGGRRARRRRQTAGRGHAGRGAGGSGRAAAPAAGAAAAGARAAQGQSRGPGSMAARPARREGLDRTGAGAGVAGQARGQARFPGGAGTDPDAELPGIRQPRARRLSDRGRPGLRV